MQATYQYILGAWLPSSNYDLDDRIFFCEMGKNYQNTSPDSEELVYIPIREKHNGSL
jgi:AraC family transcriptional regulator